MNIYIYIHITRFYYYDRAKIKIIKTSNDSVAVEVDTIKPLIIFEKFVNAGTLFCAM